MAMVFVHYRAAVLAFTYDESWTFNAFVRSDWNSTFWNLDPVANNHILHSLLMKISWNLFGISEYALRIPVLLAHLLFLIMSFKLLKLFFPKYAIWAFLALNFQPYLLDYFVCARGYGLSISFMMAAYYHLLCYWESQKTKSLILLGFFSVLMLWSNFTYLLLLISFLALAFGIIIYKNKSSINHFTALLFLPLAGLLMLFKPIKRLLERGEFFFGGLESFYSDTVLSLSKRMLYDFTDAPIFLSLFPLLVFIFLILAISGIIKNSKKNPKNKINPLFFHLIIFLGPIIGSILLHHLFAKPYLIERTALFILPLSIILIFGVLEYFKNEKGFLRGQRVFVIVFMVFTVFNFSQSINFNYLIDFKEHSDTRNALLNLREIRSVDEQNYFVLGKSKYMNATINFYRFKEELNFLPGSDLRFCNENGPYPYYYLFAEDLYCIADLNLELVKYFPISDTYLFRNPDFINKN